MKSDDISFSVTMSRNELMTHIRKPCFVNWTRLVKTQARSSICDRCPIRNNLLQFINENPEKFSQDQMKILQEVKKRWV